jgi:hypothetical protein
MMPRTLESILLPSSPSSYVCGALWSFSCVCESCVFRAKVCQTQLGHCFQKAFLKRLWDSFELAPTQLGHCFQNAFCHETLENSC